MYEYVEKFNALEKSCCNLGLPEKLLVEYMLDRLRKIGRKLLDASAGSTIMSLSPAGARRKIMEMAESARFQDESIEEEYTRTRNVSRAEPPSNPMAEELKQLKEMMAQVLKRQPAQTKLCGYCDAVDHKTDNCLTIGEDDQGEVNFVGDYQGYNNRIAPARQYGSTTTGQGSNGQYWRNDNNRTQRDPIQQAAPQQNPQPYRPPHRHQPSKSLEDIVKDLATSVHQFQAKTDWAIANLSKQMSNLAKDVSELKRDPGKLPSQTVPNPRGNVSMMGVVDVDAALKDSAYWVNKMLEPVDTEIKARGSEEELGSDSTEPIEDLGPLASEEEPAETLGLDVFESGRLLTTKNFETNISSYSMQVIAPEGHVTYKDELEGRLEPRLKQNDPIMEHPLVTSHESPRKSKHPGAFKVTCGIGKAQIHNCLIDLGAAVNVMPYSLYCSLKLGLLKPPKLLIELGDKSCTRPDGLLQNLTLRVGDLVVPVDFYVLQMGDSRNDVPPALILGRPFLFSTKTIIDMGTGLLSLAFGGKTVDFYIYGDDDRPCTRKPPDIVHTSDLGALVQDLPEETEHATGPVAMSKRSSPSREYVKANPPDRRRADPSTSLHGEVGQIEGGAETKYDLTRPWDPNL
ncbi:unnamed protein product [Rhodiola kirilowii]